MTYKEIEKNERKRDDILKMPDEPAGSRQVKLQYLAKAVGASVSHKPWGDCCAGEPELIDNINDALRTSTMIVMSKTANRNFTIALIATVIAFGSALAAWIAVLSS